MALVLAAFVYAYQMLNRQRGLSEWEIAQKSILAFNDALETTAWKGAGATRSTRFTAQYGYLQLVPNANTLTISATVNGVFQTLSNATYPGATGFIQYWLSNEYVSFDPNYESWIMGDSSPVITGSGSCGRAVVRQQPGMVSMTLDYRVRALRTSVINVGGVDTNYVDIYVIKLSTLVTHAWSYVGEFDLQAKTLSVRTASYSFSGVSNQTSVVRVQMGSEAGQVSVGLTVPGAIVFNVMVAEVQVSV